MKRIPHYRIAISRAKNGGLHYNRLNLLTRMYPLLLKSYPKFGQVSLKIGLGLR